MGQQIKFIASAAMDDFNQNYSDGTSFFLIEDFIYRIGNIAADMYRTLWRQMYDEIRQERRDEVVGFEPSVLSEQVVKVKKEGMEWVGEIEKPAMSLPYDKQSSGFNNVFDAKTGIELERSNINETWQYQYLPYSNRLFYRIDKNRLKIFTKGSANIQEARMLYVPSISIGDGDAELPDGMVNYVITNTVGYMRAMQQGKIIKKSLDGQENMIMESEINKESVTK